MKNDDDDKVGENTSANTEASSTEPASLAGQENTTAGTKALEATMPELASVLKNEAEFNGAQRADWLGHFQTTQIKEAEVLAIVAPKRDTAASRRRLKAQLTIARHGIKRWLRGRALIWRVLYAFGWLYLLIASSVKLGWGLLPVLGLLSVVIAKARFVIRDMRPKNMQLVDRGYNERKLLFGTLLETAQRWYDAEPNADQLEQYRREALTLIAGYVRDHRARYGSRDIIANLLVKDGDNVVVVGRSDNLRPIPKMYTREECALVATSLDTGEPQLTGDLYADFPSTIAGKNYRSILVLPVWFRGFVVGAVSIDSHEKYHFHLDYDDLQIHLAPYVQLLAVTLIQGHDKTSSEHS